MKRFFCTTCQKVRRARAYPSDITNTDSPLPHRSGTCAWHRGRKRVFRVTSTKSFVRPVKTSSTPTAPKKGKK